MGGSPGEPSPYVSLDPVGTEDEHQEAYGKSEPHKSMLDEGDENDPNNNSRMDTFQGRNIVSRRDLVAASMRDPKVQTIG